MLNKDSNKEFIYGIRVDADTRERMRLAEARVNWPEYLRYTIELKLQKLARAKNGLKRKTPSDRNR